MQGMTAGITVCIMAEDTTVRILVQIMGGAMTAIVTDMVGIQGIMEGTTEDIVADGTVADGTVVEGMAVEDMAVDIAAGEMAVVEEMAGVEETAEEEAEAEVIEAPAARHKSVSRLAESVSSRVIATRA